VNEKTAKGYVNGLRLHVGLRGNAYYYKFKFGGKTYEGSTDTDRLREATAHLEALKTALREEKKRGTLLRNALPTLARAYSDWRAEISAHASKGHLKSVASYWRLHLEPHLGHLRLNAVTTAAVEKCRAAYLAEGGTYGGANSLLKLLDTLLGWAIRHDILLRKPYRVGKLRVQQAPRPILSGALAPQFLAEIDRARNPHVHLAVRLMLGLGLREDEALTARWEWLDLRRMTYTPGKTKGREAVPVDVPQWLGAYLEPHWQESGLMLPAVEADPENEIEEAPHFAGFTKKAIARAADAVKLPGLTPHRLRATFATLHADAGTPTTEIQAMLRHKEIETTLRYVESGRQSQREAQRKVAEMMGLQKPPEKPKRSKGGKNGGNLKHTTDKY